MVAAPLSPAPARSARRSPGACRDLRAARAGWRAAPPPRSRSRSRACARGSESTASATSAAIASRVASSSSRPGCPARDLGRDEGAPAAVDHDRDEDRAIVHQLATRADGDVIGRDDLLAVQREPPGRRLADHRGRPRREPQQVAVLDEHRFRHLQRAGQAAPCACMWRASPCTGTAICGLIHWYIWRSSPRQGWPETWTPASVLRDDLDAAPQQPVVQVADGPLVARNDLRREDHRIAFPEAHPRMAVAGDPGHGGTRLALAAGAEIDHLAAVQRRALVLGEQPHVVQIAARARRPHVALQRAPDQHRLSPCIPRRQRDVDSSRATLEAKRVTARPCSRSAIRRASVSRTSPSDPDSPSTVALVESPTSASTPGLARLPQTPPRPADRPPAGSGIDLPVAGVHDAPVGRLDQQRVRLRNRMGERDEGEREGPEIEPAGERHLGQRHLGEQALRPPASRAARRRRRGSRTRGSAASARDRRPRPDGPRGRGSARWRAGPSGAPR